jgi:protein-tyrosine phosphatase
MSDPDPQHPFHFDSIACPWGGRLYLMSCPGRQGMDDQGRVWRRDLQADLDQLAHHGIEAVITLLPEEEMQHYQVLDLPQAIAKRDWVWWHWPVTDRAIADEHISKQIQATAPKLRDILQKGGGIAIHCAAGLGRTGTLAAQLLVMQGVEPDQAILEIRQARRGSIETLAQEQAVRDQKIEDGSVLV